jgi:acetyl esterase
MSTRHLVDPDLLAMVNTTSDDKLTADNLAEFRRSIVTRTANLPRPNIEPKISYAPGRNGAPDVRVLIYDPLTPGSNRPVVLHMHGGGMIAGGAELNSLGIGSLALELGAVVVSVEYRLAPETPFPGPQEDCYAALAWLFEKSTALNISKSKIVVSGDSAGGGLAAAVAIMARDRKEFTPLAQFLIYPMLDHRTGGPHDPYRNVNAGEFIVTRERNQFAWQSVRGSYAVDDSRAAWFSPSLVLDLTGLAPAWIGTGSLDLFVDENVDYARRLADAGVPAQLHVYEGAVHGFPAIASAAVSQRFIRDATYTLGQWFM